MTADEGPLLHLDEGGAWLRLSPASPPIALALDSGAWAKERFRHQPPSPLEIEHAIEHIEDIIMPLARQLPAQARLRLSGAPMQRVFEALASEPDAAARTQTLDIDLIEAAFGRLAARSQGRPPGRDDVPDDAAFACSLVLLRELMHHWRLKDLAPA